MDGAKKWNNEQKAVEKAVKDCSRKGDHTQYQIVVDLHCQWCLIGTKNARFKVQHVMIVDGLWWITYENMGMQG